MASSKVLDRVLIGTFHKSGTLLCLNVFRTLAAKHGLVLWYRNEQPVEPADWNICFDDHSTWADDPAFVGKYRGMIVVRDPRDLVVSAAHYHTKADEEWLHQPQDRFNGQTYQQKINSLQTMQERFFFEIEYSSGSTIKNMLRLTRSVPETIRVVKLEDLSHDSYLYTWHSIFEHLELSVEALSSALSIVFTNSIGHGQVGTGGHVRSGKPGQFKDELDDLVLARLQKKFPGALSLLGYDLPQERKRFTEKLRNSLNGLYDRFSL